VLGGKALLLSFDGKDFSWPFLLAAVHFPIIGVEFLRHYGLLVDPAGNRLVDRHTFQSFCSSPLGDFQPVTATSTVLSLVSPASFLLTGLSTGTLASTATCGKQVRASGVPRVKVPSGSRGTLLEAAHMALVDTVSRILGEFLEVVTCSRCGASNKDSWATNSLQISEVGRQQAGGRQA
jgi:hypothetical protein